jgi:hypothetical protein
MRRGLEKGHHTRPEVSENAPLFDLAENLAQCR